MGTMTSPPPDGISALEPAAADDAGLVGSVTHLVNAVYAVAEEGLWQDGVTRTKLEEVRRFVGAGEIVVATVGGTVAGCLRAQWLGDDLAGLGMLAVAPEHRSTGLGRDLVAFAERRALDAGRVTMQLEVLVPRDWSHPSKDHLAGWYPHLGYRIVRTGTIDEPYPHLAPLLATPCDFVIYHKSLR
jgi:GNAT superfamily N-acetyltransferase